MSLKFKAGDLIRVQERYKDHWHDSYNYVLILTIDMAQHRRKYQVLLRGETYIVGLWCIDVDGQFEIVNEQSTI